MHRTARAHLILDADVLSDAYLPERLIGRETQATEVHRWLGTAVESRAPIHVWLHGPSGAGKTATALRGLSVLRDAGITNSAVLNCWEHNTYFEVLDALVGELRILRAEEHRSSLKLERIRRHLGGRPFVVMLDEVDQMRPAERGTTLYNFARLGTVSLVAIANHARALHELDERVRSRLSPRVIAFPPYRTGEMVTLLRDLAARALVSRAVAEGDLERIAAIAAGDARVAIQLLRNTAHSAELVGEQRITPDSLAREWRHAKAATQARALEALTEDHRLLYRIVAQQTAVTSGRLWQAYVHRCAEVKRKPLALRTFSNYANRLVQAGLLGCAPARVKGRERLFSIRGECE